MQHTESSIKVYFTTNYTIFKAIKGNRLLNESKINRIISDIKSGLDMLRYYPIVVDENMNVIDGQHRLFIAKKLKTNIYYIISKKIELNSIAKINSNTEKWNNDDFINCYIVNGSKDYEILRDFKEKYQFPLSVSQYLLMFGSSERTELDGTDMKDLFQSGQFKVRFEQQAIDIAEKVMLFSKFKNHRSRYFIVAVNKVMTIGKCNVEDIAEKYNQQDASALKMQPNYKGYLTNLEEIVNYKCSKRRTIFLENCPPRSKNKMSYIFDKRRGFFFRTSLRNRINIA